MEANLEKKRKRPEAVGVEEEEQEVEQKKQRSGEAREEEVAGGAGRSQPASMTEDLLPEDLVLRVFSRLPARSVFRFGTASKNWNNLLASSFFWLSSHLAPPSDVHIAYAINCVASNRFSFHSEAPRSAFSHNFASEFSYRYFGTSSGLVALQVSRMVGGRFTGCLIVNPATKIEANLILLRVDPSHKLCGFGYCASAKKYKLLMLRNGSLLIQTFGDNMGAMPRMVCSNGVTDFDPSICLGDAVYLLESTGAGGDRVPNLIRLMLSDEMIQKVDLPVEGEPLLSGLIEMSGSRRAATTTQRFIYGG